MIQSTSGLATAALVVLLMAVSAPSVLVTANHNETADDFQPIDVVVSIKEKTLVETDPAELD